MEIQPLGGASRRSRILRRLTIVLAPGSPYVEIPEAEHHVMIDQPLAFVAGLSALLAAWPLSKAG